MFLKKNIMLDLIKEWILYSSLTSVHTFVKVTVALGN